MPLELVAIRCLTDNYAWLLHGNGRTALIDAPEAAPILAELAARDWSLDLIALTHHHADHIQAVPDLVEQALRNGGPHGDNVTVLSLEWEELAEQEGASGISTQTLSEDVFASTIQATMADTAPIDLDEAEIERSIREINEAIQRAARKPR